MKLILENNIYSNIHADFGIKFLTKETLENDPHKTLLESAGFKATQDETSLLLESKVLVCGVENYSADALRSATAAAIRILSKHTHQRIKLSAFGLENIQAITEGLILGAYQFQHYKSEKNENTIAEVVLASETQSGELAEYEPMKNVFEAAKIIATATNFTRDLVNATPEDIYPEALANVARDLADRNDLTCKVLDEVALRDENMSAMLAVGRASIHQPRLIHLSYKPENPSHVISLVGKGLTYDSGGLSLKPATSMVTMKMDKAGACAVLGMMKAVSELGLPIEVHGFLGAAENMVDANSYKPDDVLRSKNGKTIEVRNTDAEGRLVLADVLAYAQQEVNADFIFDYATLTGACMVALGPYTTGVMGHCDQLKNDIADAASSSGELIGTLPFNHHLKKLIKSDIADVCNISSKPYGGAITAGLFLDHFIDKEMKEKWLHFDIAGSAYTESNWDCNNYGGTGAGVRMTLKFLQNLSHQS
jgi:leucyl aminopeptidase